MQELEIALKTLQHSLSKLELKKAYEEVSQSYRHKLPTRLDSIEKQTAYVLARMPATVAVIQEVLTQLPPDLKNIKSLLDLGSGPGSVLWAAKDTLGELESIILVDQESSLMRLGKELISSSFKDISLHWLTSKLPLLPGTVTSEKYDLITASYLLNELSPSEQSKLLENIWQLATQLIILIEPGTPDGFMNIRNAREALISKGAYILAPCTHNSECPMSRSDWCHFSTRLERTLEHRSIKGSVPYEDEKYSYLIASKLHLPDRNLARIVKKPRKGSGLIELDLCQHDGLQRLKISKRNKNLYKSSKKLNWGNVFTIEEF